ncbi:uracil-DNA glycosylase [Cognatishimia maritima]|uniref:Type-4 uracil-DNA glycosylase n=1 Tax=Cognatishimia maritima TaxID=870908 RepID=A0A1M5RQ08_9RHOB|nr:uracil-DNA glycosylase [Cognatishimia maritima]SHH28299.1 DNA polymerase [Cognatishimia maritima]
MESGLDFHTAKALLEWQVELGATEAILDAPVNRYEIPEKKAQPVAKAAEPAAPVKEDAVDPVEVAKTLAQQAGDLKQLKAAIANFDHCALKRGARSLVFSDGHPSARVMIIGEAPGRDEDRIGRPFVGRAGQLLDKMLAAIDMDRTSEDKDAAVYITNVLPWRPPQNRDPQPEEIFMMMPFVRRHVELVDPDVVVLMGNIACHGVLGKRGITRLRGQWVEALGRPVLPMFHPAFLLRSPHMKREAWADLLDLKAKLKSLG